MLYLRGVRSRYLGKVHDKAALITLYTIPELLVLYRLTIFGSLVSASIFVRARSYVSDSFISQ